MSRAGESEERRNKWRMKE